MYQGLGICPCCKLLSFWWVGVEVCSCAHTSVLCSPPLDVFWSVLALHVRASNWGASQEIKERAGKRCIRGDIPSGPWASLWGGVTHVSDVYGLLCLFEELSRAPCGKDRKCMAMWWFGLSCGQCGSHHTQLEAEDRLGIGRRAEVRWGHVGVLAQLACGLAVGEQDNK